MMHVHENHFCIFTGVEDSGVVFKSKDWTVTDDGTVTENNRTRFSQNPKTLLAGTRLRNASNFKSHRVFYCKLLPLFWLLLSLRPLIVGRRY